MGGPKCEEYLKKWILERKLSMPVEDLQPSVWFNQQWAKFQQTTKLWHIKLSEYKQMLTRKANEKQMKEATRRAKAQQKALEKQVREERKKAMKEAKKMAKEAAKKLAAEQKEAEEKKKDEEGADADKKDEDGEKKDIKPMVVDADEEKKKE